MASNQQDGVVDKARIDRDLIANLRESSRPLRPEASLTAPTSRGTNADVQAILEDLATRLARLERRLDQLNRSGDPIARGGHTLFLSTASGYEILERDGLPPRLGDELVVDGTTYRAHSYRRSPFPDDPRPCVTVEIAVSDGPP